MSTIRAAITSLLHRFTIRLGYSFFLHDLYAWHSHLFFLTLYVTFFFFGFRGRLPGYERLEIAHFRILAPEIIRGPRSLL